jgi:hypothetical protein
LTVSKEFRMKRERCPTVPRYRRIGRSCASNRKCLDDNCRNPNSEGKKGANRGKITVLGRGHEKCQLTWGIGNLCLTHTVNVDKSTSGFRVVPQSPRQRETTRSSHYTTGYGFRNVENIGQRYRKVPDYGMGLRLERYLEDAGIYM